MEVECVHDDKELIAVCFFLLQDEEHHEQTSDVRTQLKFFEQLERLEKQRKDDEEREILLKVAKVGSAFLTRVQSEVDIRLILVIVIRTA